MSTTPTMTNTEIKAMQEARVAANKKVAAKVARLLLKEAPVHEFGTGSQGRFVRANVEIDGEPVTVQFQVVLRNTVKKDKGAAAPAKPASKAKARPAPTPGVSLVKATDTP